jgi:hypothetical protein
MNIHDTLSRRAVRLAAALALSSGLLAVAAPAASAQALVTVPPGCGSLSGTQVPANRLEDHSNDSVPLGAPGNPYVTNLSADRITIGTRFDDVIAGTAISEVICGIGGNDNIFGRAGDDELCGGGGNDDLFGEEDADFLSGAEGADDLYGDDTTNSHGNLDRDDRIQGGIGNDSLFGGADVNGDVLRGGPDTDDGQGGETCSTIENPLSPLC